MNPYIERQRSKPRIYFDDQSIAPGFSGYVFKTSYDNATNFTHEFKSWLFNAQGGKCGYCGEDLGSTWQDNRAAHVEHIQRKRDGGSDLPPNIVYACGPCNHQKKDRHYSELLVRIPMRRAGIAGLLRLEITKTLIENGVLSIKPLERFYFEECGWTHAKPPQEQPQ